MFLEFDFTIARRFIATGVLVLSGCTSLDNSEINPDQANLSYDGKWIAKVSKFKREQLAPAPVGGNYSHTKWTCGDGKPFQFQLNVKDGSVYFLKGKPIRIGKVSSGSRFKSIYAWEDDFTDVYTGNFKNKVGKLQSRKNGVNGCQYKFTLVKM